MFGNLKKKTKKNQEINFSSLPQFHFWSLHLYISKSTNNFAKKIYILKKISKSRMSPKNIKKFVCKLILWDPNQNFKDTICPLGDKVFFSFIF